WPPHRRALASSRRGTAGRAGRARRLRSPRRRAPHLRGPRRAGWRSRAHRDVAGTAEATRIENALHPAACVAWSGEPPERARARVEFRASGTRVAVHSAAMPRPTPRFLVQVVALGAAMLLGRPGAAQSPPARFGDGCCAITQATCGAPPVLAVF